MQDDAAATPPPAPDPPMADVIGAVALIAADAAKAERIAELEAVPSFSKRSGQAPMIERALLFATAAHAAVGQLRRYTNEPYVLHPIAVAEIVKSIPHDDGMIAAALLHDVVEDTKIEASMIYEVFGADVAHLVEWLTDSDSYGPRAERKAADRKRLSRAPGRAQTIKVADLIHNLASIVARDPDFARVYMREKAALVDVLDRADPSLIARARQQLRDFGATA